MSVKVKICGITSVEDAGMVRDAGADLMGFNFWEGSPRYITPEKAAEIVQIAGLEFSGVALFVNAEMDHVRRVCARTGIINVQLHGEETPEYCRELGELGLDVMKVIRVKDHEDLRLLDRYHVASFLLDSHGSKSLPGGTGRTFDWSLLGGLSERHRFFLAGGLTPENVAQAVRQVHPYGVDAASGVEKSPGIKDPAKVRAFIKNAKSSTENGG